MEQTPDQGPPDGPSSGGLGERRRGAWDELCKIIGAWVVVFVILLFLFDRQHTWYVWHIGSALAATSPVLIARGLVALFAGRFSRSDYVSGRSVADLTFGLIGLPLGIILLGIAAWEYDHHLHAVRQASCYINLKGFGFFCEAYAADHPDGLFPELSTDPGGLVCAPYLIQGQSIDPRTLLCPSSGNPGDEDAPLDDGSYFYLGYAVTNDVEMRAFADAYRERIAAGLPFNEDLAVAPGKGYQGSDTIPRLRSSLGEGTALSTDAPPDIRSRIPVIIERVGHHRPTGANVVFLDNHVEYIRYPGKWPMTEATVAILDELDCPGRATGGSE